MLLSRQICTILMLFCVCIYTVLCCAPTNPANNAQAQVVITTSSTTQSPAEAQAAAAAAAAAASNAAAAQAAASAMRAAPPRAPRPSTAAREPPEAAEEEAELNAGLVEARDDTDESFGVEVTETGDNDESFVVEVTEAGDIDESFEVEVTEAGDSEKSFEVEVTEAGDSEKSFEVEVTEAADTEKSFEVEVTEAGGNKETEDGTPTRDQQIVITFEDEPDEVIDVTGDAPPRPVPHAPTSCQEICQLSDLKNFDAMLHVELQGHNCGAAGAVALIKCQGGRKVTMGFANTRAVSTAAVKCNEDTGSWNDLQGNPLTSLACDTCEPVDSCNAEKFTLLDNNLTANIVGGGCIAEHTMIAFNCVNQSPLQVTARDTKVWVKSPHQQLLECKAGELRVAGTELAVSNVACTGCETTCSTEELNILDENVRVDLLNNAACGFQTATATISCLGATSTTFAVSVATRTFPKEGLLTLTCSELGWTTLTNELVIGIGCDPCSSLQINEGAVNTLIGRNCFVFEPKTFQVDADFDESRMECEANGGRLAWVDSKHKLQSLIAAFGPTATLFFFDEAWVGLQQNFGAEDVKEWRFLSLDSKPFFQEAHILPWGEGQPNDPEYSDDEGALSFTDGGLVDRNQYSIDLPYICEYVDAV